MEKEKTTISLSDLVLTPNWARQPPSSQKDYTQLQKEEPKKEEKKKSVKTAKKVSSIALNTSHQGKSKENPAESAKKSYPAEKKVITQKPQINISFIPERHGLKTLVTRLAKSLVAYPLLEIAAMFLTKPEYYDVKYEVEGDTTGKNNPDTAKKSSFLFQCKQCEQLFLEKSHLENHIISKHFNNFFDIEEKQGDAPKGNFMCVAKCSLNGEVLCPPNYHEFNEKLLELHRTKFAHIPLEDFRKTIVNDSDPALLEQWKKTAATQKLYKLKEEKRGEHPAKEFSKRSDAELFMIANYVPALIKEGKRFVISGTTSVSLEDQTLASLTRNAFEKEKRSPVKIAAAVYPAFKNLGMKTFKWYGRVTYVAGVEPNARPLEPEQTTGMIRQILEWLNANPDKTKAELLNAFVPGATPESPAYAEVVSQLRWLIERGYIIEFSNGKLSLVGRKNPKYHKPTSNDSHPSSSNAKSATTDSSIEKENTTASDATQSPS